jgi:peptidoglycan/xylan/chitin deacetylase (PgdA/CDA1 family)
MTQEQLEMLSDHQLYSIGGHSHAHKHLTEYSDDELEEDLSSSKQILAELIQADIKHFSYPYGDFNKNVRKTVTTTGFETAVTTCSRSLEYRRCENRSAIPRIDGGTQFNEWFDDR